jgi:Protein of unknown function (DUF551)
MKNKINFLKETIDALKFHDCPEDSILWVGDLAHSCNWDEFKKKADFEYYNREAKPYINFHLKIVGKDWCLHRVHYHDNEWWSYRTYKDWWLYRAPSDNNKSFIFKNYDEAPRGRNLTLEHNDLIPIPFKWISIKEKLPPINEWVLTLTVNFGIRLMKFNKEREWIMDTLALPFGDDFVTHWMLLPKRPHEDLLP